MMVADQQIEPNAGPPLVSVIIPVFNAEKYLHAAIDSILSQDYPNFEVVCVDDGSTDSSLAILESYAAEDNRVMVVSRPNTGIVGALNDAIEHSRGELLMRMDADDASLPGRMRRQVEFLLDTPECVAVGSDLMLVDEEMRPIIVAATERKHNAIMEKAIEHLETPLNHATLMIRREAILEINGYREQYKHVEDYDLLVRLSEVGELASIDEVTYEYRQLATSICRTKKKEQRELLVKCWQETLSRRGISVSKQPEEFLLPYEISASRHYVNVAVQAILGGNPQTARANAALACYHAPWNPLPYAGYALSFFPRNVTRFLVKVFLGRST